MGSKLGTGNPARSSQDSLGVAYSEGESLELFGLDFIFFGENGDGTTAADIVDPHGIHFSEMHCRSHGDV